ncbi:MAG: carboxypeptidase regulatory-like domain-containing protein [Nitrospira sp.]|nr:carboxypeptidase regulatory-like domain-containing protein [Nitrospira sp.]MCA9457877.1 carboxypeptidase regulatory-like domain-containing protein [Nitrospira sp.]MCW5785784.1 carboxypeptidase regulatory-like domain-containing protein [Nitrospirales bacterium]
MCQSFRFRILFQGILGGFLILGSVLEVSVSHAGEIYGRVAQDGKPLSGTSVTIECPSLSKGQTTTTDRNGVYRFPSGPSGEEQCKVSVEGSSNAVTIFTSKRRTSANLEIMKGRLRKR